MEVDCHDVLRLYWIIDNCVLIPLIYLSLLEMFHFIQPHRRHNKLLYLDSMNLQFKGVDVDDDDIAVVGLKDYPLTMFSVRFN